MPKREITVEQYLRKFPKSIREVANNLRTLVKQVAPDCIERVYSGWKLIGYRAVNGNKSHYFGFIFPTDDKVVLGFEYGTMLSDQHKTLEGTGTQVRYITVYKQKEIRKSIITPLIAEAVSIAVERKPHNTRKGKR